MHDPPRLVVMCTDGEHRTGPMFWCVACDEAHGGFPGWTWDGNESSPTITPSYRVRSGCWPGETPKPMCHVNVTRGMLVYHSDSEHHLKGQTVPMVPF